MVLKQHILTFLNGHMIITKCQYTMDFLLSNYWYLKERATQEVRDNQTQEYLTPEFANELFRKCDNWIDLENNMASVLQKLSEAPLSQYDKDRSIFKELFDRFLLPEFESYIANYINQQSPAKTYHMEHDDLVLSFNYSNTFERIYSSKADICYLNGKAESNDEKSHIVFG